MDSDLTYQVDNFSMENLYTMLVVDFVMFVFLGFYLENVIPSEYGSSKPFYFLFTKKYWCGDKDQYLEGKNQIQTSEQKNINNNCTGIFCN